MTAELLVLRHGKSAWPAGVEDADRPLAPRGEQAAATVGQFLARAKLTPARVVASPARRATDTARRVLEAAGSDGPIRADERLYGGDALDVLRDEPDGRGPVLLVGHEPELVALVESLTGAVVRLPTGGLVVIELEAPFARQPAPGNLLRLVVGPKQL